MDISDGHGLLRLLMISIHPSPPSFGENSSPTN